MIVVPRLAATTMILRDDLRGRTEVLVMQRRAGLAFAPGLFVFPGGTVDPSDGELDPLRHHHGRSEAQIDQTMAAPGAGYTHLATAIRECFEEVGVLFARPALPNGNARLAHSPLISHHALGPNIGSLREDLEQGRLGIADLCEDLEMSLAFDQLCYTGHFVTPVGSPRRYDTRFFVALMPPDQDVLAVNSEATHAQWRRPADLLDSHKIGDIGLINATQHSLEQIAGYACSADVIAAARLAQNTVSGPTTRDIGDGHLVIFPGLGISEALTRADTVGGG